MRPIQILANPVAEPGICGKCTAQDKDWFVDLGFDTMFNSTQADTGYPLWTDGVVYLCCDCFNSLVVDAHAAFQGFFPDVIDPRPNFTSPVGLEDIDLEEDEIEEEETEEEVDDNVYAFEEDNEIRITVPFIDVGPDNSMHGVALPVEEIKEVYVGVYDGLEDEEEEYGTDGTDATVDPGEPESDDLSVAEDAGTSGEEPVSSNVLAGISFGS